MTRRDLLVAAARLGGAGLATGLIEAMGLAGDRVPTDLASLDPIGAAAPEVLILGAGISGMCAAYELEALGYRCRILEARHRSGGRCVTIRHGDRIEEAGEPQICQFEDGHFFNPGPTRIPHWHITLDYCRKFGVAVAPWVNVNENAYILQTRGKYANKPIRIRQVVADTEGHMASALFDAIKKGGTGAEWSPQDRATVLLYLSSYALLDSEGVYRGISHGAINDLDPVEPNEPHHDPIDLATLFAGGVGQYFNFINSMDYVTMLEIVGGVDRIAKAFERNLRTRIEFGCEVTDIHTTPAETMVTFKDRSGKSHLARAPHCICTIPLSVLKKIPTNFTKSTSDAIQRSSYWAMTKTAAEFGGRFWEQDDRIYGGISWTDQTIHQILYPSWGYQTSSGVLVGYNDGGKAAAFNGIPPSQRIKEAMSEVAKIHPQSPRHFKNAVTVSWDRVPFSRGAVVVWGYDLYKLMQEPEASLYFAGEHCSQIPAWMAGAIESARAVVKKLHTKASTTAAR